MDASDKSGSAASALDWSLLRARISAELGRDKKKAAILGVLILVGAVLGFRVLAKGLPQQAVASASVRAASAAPSIACGKDPGEAGRQGSADQENQRVAYIRQLNYDFARDLFAVNPDYFPPPPKPLRAGPRVVIGDSDAQETLRLVQKEANTLILQSTMIGTAPVAVIDGPPDIDGKKGPRMLRVGETINGFEVTQISCRSCTMKKNDVTVLLEMKGQKPGN